jgi:preprotein translocase SecF subunit
MIDILKNRMYFYWVSTLWIVFSLCMFAFGSLNYGIDMTGGIQIEYQSLSGSIDIEEIKRLTNTVTQDINQQKEGIINTTNVYKISGQESFVVEVGISKKYSDAESENYKVAYREKLSELLLQNWKTQSSYVNIGASFWDYIKDTAKLTILLALVGISLYVAYAFSGTVAGIPSISFALITLLTLFHDVLISAGLYIFTSFYFPQFQIDTFFITSLLTILWYSINDTIVIFDRIRSNLREFWGKGKPLSEIIQNSVNETMTRSIYTSLTLFFVLICMFILWPESIQGFTLTMLFGTVVGSLSSIFIASPLLYDIHKHTVLSVYLKKENVSDDDKMVV